MWDRRPDAGPRPARDAYTGYPFRINVAYAERFAAEWLILSAKYGLIPPDFAIPGPYDVSFNRPAAGAIGHDDLQGQVKELGLAGWPTVVALGGRHYREAVVAAFAGTGAYVRSPFAGLPLGRMIQATRQAVERGDPALSD